MKQFAAAILATCALATPDVAFESLGKFKVKNAAFPTVSKFYGSTEDFMLVSSFGALSSGAVYVVPDIKDAVMGNVEVSDLNSVKLDTPKFEWPNDVKVVPNDVFNSRAIVVPDGFLVPGKSNGGVYVIEMDESDITKTKRTVKISTEPKGYFYHMGEWIDLNGDGRKDFLTARSNAKKGHGELVWFEHPVDGLDGEWIEHIVVSGPDVGIQVQHIDQFPGEIVVFAAEFFNEKVSFYRVSTKDGALVDYRVIDDSSIESAYSVTFVDLNNDGVPELMVNNHETKSKDDGIWAYQFPSDWMTGDFNKVALATDFKNKFSMTVPNMAPGFPYAIWPETRTEGKAPAHIVVAGDGDYTAHIMTPVDAKNFEWDLDTIKDEGGTVGALAMSDLDNNGWLELWVPNYDKSYIELWKFSALADYSREDEAQLFLQ